jgi:hypothetical protein
LSNLGLLVLGVGATIPVDDEDLVIDRYGGAGRDIVDASGRASVDTSLARSPICLIGGS